MVNMQHPPDKYPGYRREVGTWGSTNTLAQTGSSAGVAPTSSPLTLADTLDMRSKANAAFEPNVIAVPGYRTPPTSTWGISTELQQAAQSVNSVSRLHMHIYQPTYESSQEFSWEQFLKTGNDLAEELARLVTEYPNRPIIFVAHSLGGVLLKKALLLAHENVQDPRFKLVVECLSGILFMGTPHASVSDEDTLLRHNQVLYSCAKIAAQKQSSKLPRHDVFQLANLAACFEQIATIPVLSVFEYATAPRGLFAKKSKTLVDEQLATINSHTEQLLGVHLSHTELCKLSQVRSDSYSARGFLRSLLEDLARNKKWTGELGPPTRAGTIRSTHTDPLNPLNLAPIGLPSAMKKRVNSMSEQSLKQDTRPPPSLQLPLHLRLVSKAESVSEVREPKLPCFMLPQLPNPEFIGRQNVFELMDKQLLGQNASTSEGVQNTRLFAICGMGGIGKTDLAVEYAYSRRSHFGAIFWLEAGGMSQLASDFGRITTQLGLETAEEADSLESGIEVAKTWLAKPRRPDDKDNWLLIFDNADNLDNIASYVPNHGNGAVLVTSRDPFAKDHFFSDGCGVDLEPLSTTDSATLLRKLVTPGKASDAQDAEEVDAAEQLAAHLDGLPLAMTQMAGFIRRRRISIREFIDLYANDARYAEIHGVGNPALERRYGYTLATAYNFEDLAASNPKALHLLELLAFMNPDRIQEEIFVLPKGTKKKTGSPYWTAHAFDSARYDLLGSSIIKRDINKKELWVHRVIQAEVRTRLDEEACYNRFKEAVSLMAGVWPPGNASSQRVTRWEVCERLLPHLERFYQVYIDYSEAWEDFEVDPAFPSLMNEAAVYLHERGFSHEGKPYLKLGLSLCEQSNLTIEPLISDMHLCMGALSNETNDTQSCLDHNIICLAIRKAEATKGKAPDLRLAFAHSQMGIAYMMAGKFALATEYFKQSVEMLYSIEVDPDEFGFPSCNLGLAYWVQDKLDEADKTLTDLLEQREKLHGKLDTVSYKTGRVLQALGNVRASKAMQLERDDQLDAAARFWDESFAIHQDCLKQYESTLGKFNHRTGDACHKLAEHYIRLKEHEVAQNYLDRAIRIWGDRHWFKNESARSSFLRGTHLISVGGEENLKQGNFWVERAMALRREILPDEQPGQLETDDFDKLVCFWSI